jgi:hypothetical protein
MDPEIVHVKMAAQVRQAQESKLASVCGWAFESQGLIVHVTMRPRRRLDAFYILRVAFDDFPRIAPSYVFVDAKAREMTPAAWPPNVKHGGEPPGICTPGTREFHDHYHRGDAQYLWDPARYSVLDTLQRIQRMIEAGLGM